MYNYIADHLAVSKTNKKGLMEEYNVGVLVCFLECPIKHLTRVLCSVAAEKTKQLQAYVTCNGKLTFYDSQLNMLVVTNNLAGNFSNYTLNPGTEVLGMKCRTYKSKPWIMGSASNGLVTDTRWKCLSLKADESKDEAIKGRSWATERDFDDSHWTQAVANSSNQEGSPWEKVPDISEDAFWISTAYEDDVKLYCRRRMSKVLVKRAKSNGMSFINAIRRKMLIAKLQGQCHREIALRSPT